MQQIINLVGVSVLGAVGVAIPLVAFITSLNDSNDYQVLCFGIVGGWVCGIAFCALIAALKALYG